MHKLLTANQKRPIRRVDVFRNERILMKSPAMAVHAARPDVTPADA